MDPIAKTAYYCCGVRAADAQGPNPVCGDRYAARFMDAEALAVYERFARFSGPNAANVARHRIIDDLLRERLHRQPSQPVVLLGAGFDTRAFRLGGGRWLELDQGALLARKEAKLPAAQSPHPLQRVPIDFARERLADKLAPWAGLAGVVVVMEGVSVYLDAAQLGATTRVLHELLPGHVLMCDLMSATFARRFSGDLRREVVRLGGDFAPAFDDPSAVVRSLGYREAASYSIAGSAVDHGSVPIPRWLLDSVLLHTLREGYKIFVFEADAL